MYLITPTWPSFNYTLKHVESVELQVRVQSDVIA